MCNTTRFWPASQHLPGLPRILLAYIAKVHLWVLELELFHHLDLLQLICCGLAERTLLVVELVLAMLAETTSLEVEGQTGKYVPPSTREVPAQLLS